jgi:3-oxoadipate enol-lactonase
MGPDVTNAAIPQADAPREPTPFDCARVGPAPQLMVEHAGSGELVVFLHGVGGHRQDWYGQLPAFADRYRAVTWDARGYGGSDDYPGPPTFPDFCRDLVRVLDHFGAASAHVVGLSMGGLIAQEFCALHPGRVRSLVLAGTSAGFPTLFDDAWIEGFLRLRCTPLRNGLGMADIAPANAAGLLAGTADEQVRARALDSLLKLRPHTYVKTLEVIARHRVSLDYASVSVPVLVIVGNEDGIMPPRGSRHLARAIPGAQLVILDGAGHLVNLEQPAEFNRAILDFLARRHSSTGGQN